MDYSLFIDMIKLAFVVFGVGISIGLKLKK